MRPLKICLLCLLLCLLFCPCVFAGEGAVYHLGADETLADAYAALYPDGGVIVVTEPTSVPAGFLPQPYAGIGKVTVTSVYDGVDYRATCGAYLAVCGAYYLPGDTEIRDITLQNEMAGYTGVIYGMGHDLHLGGGIECTLGENATRYLSVIGGSSTVYRNLSTAITIESGTWQRVRGGSIRVASVNTNYHIDWKVSGGEFRENVVLASAVVSGDVVHTGNITAEICGGTFYSGVTLTAFRTTAENASAFSGDVRMTLTGGRFYGVIGAADNTAGSFSGSFTLEIAGGDFAHVTDIVGPEELAGDMAGKICLTHGYTPRETILETSYQNPIRLNNPDPFLMYHDGFYYYTCTGSTQIEIGKSASIADLSEITRHVVLLQAVNEQGESLTDLWSPEIHYFPAEAIGEENAGWYMFISANAGNAETTAAGIRQYVCKCLDGDNLLGRWGDPVTETPNMLRRVAFTNSNYNNDKDLCGGISTITVGGKMYLTFVSETGRDDGENFYQMICITDFKNPWEIDGVPVVICTPTEEWECGGHRPTASGAWYPKVVEGAAAVYSENKVYLMYTGSGYWTKYYALNYLTYTGGDPLDAASWEKHENGPIFSYSSEVCGCGHASYLHGADGQYYACYHGYLGAEAVGGRAAFVERITVTDDGVTVGNGSGHPAPLATVYTETVQLASPLALARGFSRNSIGICEALTLLRNIIAGQETERGLADVIRLLKTIAE